MEPHTESWLFREMQSVGQWQGVRLLNGNWTPWYRLYEEKNPVEIRAQVHITHARFNNATIQIRLGSDRGTVMTMSYKQFYSLTKTLGQWAEKEHFRHFRCGLETINEPDSFCWLHGTDEGCQVMKYCLDQLGSINLTFSRIFCEQISGMLNEPAYASTPITAYARLINFEYTYLFINGSVRVLYRD